MARPDHCTALLEEGWATLYGDHFQDEDVTGSLQEALDGIAETGGLRGEHYNRAARFVAFLIDTYGVDAVKQLCVLGSLTTASAWDEAFGEVLGASFAEIESALAAYPPVRLGSLRQDQACEGDAEYAAGTPWTMELGCDAEGVVGMRGEQNSSYAVVELNSAIGAYMFQFAMPSETMIDIEIRSCERDAMASVYYGLVSLRPTAEQPAQWPVFEAPPGKYVVRLRPFEPLTEVDASTVEVSFEPLL